MTTINNYSILSNSSSTLDKSSTSSTNTALADLLASATSATSATTTTDKTSLAYQLNLSAEAQNYLSSGLSGAVSSASSSSTGSFHLSAQQEKQLNAIIQKHAGEPYTQETFDAIEQDLVKSGLGPDQLAQQAKVNAFNPTMALLDALGGTNSLASLVPSDSTINTQIQTYVNDVASRFEKVAAPDVPADTTTGSADTVA